ncbi:MAG: hydroxyacylglutathione hydrolase [Bacteroidia bacterium]|jgi:hydroxyacylglutathione hydrolase
MEVEVFTCNPFQENGYLLHNASKECILVDPGCYTHKECKVVDDFIESRGLTVTLVANTHCHIDHIFGVKYFIEKYEVPFTYHEKDQPVLDSGISTALMYGLQYDNAPNASYFIKEGEFLKLGTDHLDIVFTPGHSPGSVSFIHRKSKQIIAGDVLFRESVGRSDLLGGDQDTLFDSIRNELYTLDDAFVVFSGHGPVTSIGHEKKYNPFVKG